TRPELAKKFTDTPIYVIGVGQGSDHIGVYERDDITTMRSTVEAARQAYKMAGIRDPTKRIDLFEVHDCFTISEIMAYEDLGLCRKGEGGRLVEEGRTDLDGDFPVNMSGGLKAKGHPVGATGMAQVYEVFLQLRGEAERWRQVPDAEVGLTHNLGGSGATCVVCIFERG
ncbi:thiolase domain-containing protein, partial [Candidatus Bathyarchaeota archaeon]